MTFVIYWLQERFGSLSGRLLSVAELFPSIGDAFQSGKRGLLAGQAFLPVHPIWKRPLGQTGMSVLLSFEDGCTFFQKSTSPFAHVFGRK